jgi:glucose-6-phosphate 3-dehydrogenase
MGNFAALGREKPIRGDWDRQAVKVGIIGAGFAARAHAAALRNCIGAELCAVYSPDIEERGAFARDNGCEHLISGSELIRRCDLIIVATPNSTHKQWSLDALRASKHVLCEKPLAVSAAEAEELALAGGGGQVAVVGFNYRYMPIVATMKAALNSGLIGSPLRFHFTFRKDSALRKQASGWKAEAGQRGTGGAIGDLGIHFIDLARWLFQKSSLEKAALSIDKVHSVRHNGLDLAASIEGVVSGHVKVIAELAKNYDGPCLGVSFQLVGTDGSIQYHSTYPSEYRLITGRREKAVRLEYSSVLTDPPGEPGGWSDSFLFQSVDVIRSITSGALSSNLATFNDGFFAQRYLTQCLDIAQYEINSSTWSRSELTKSSPRRIGP